MTKLELILEAGDLFATSFSKTALRQSNGIWTKVIIEKSRGGRFLRNKNWYLGWIWASWHYWKKDIRTDYEQFLRPVFSSFRGENFFKNNNIVAFCIKKVHRMKLKKTS